MDNSTQLNSPIVATNTVTHAIAGLLMSLAVLAGIAFTLYASYSVVQKKIRSYPKGPHSRAP